MDIITPFELNTLREASTPMTPIIVTINHTLMVHCKKYTHEVLSAADASNPIGIMIEMCKLDKTACDYITEQLHLSGWGVVRIFQNGLSMMFDIYPLPGSI